MKKILVCLLMSFVIHIFCSVETKADVYLTNYSVLFFQQPYNLSGLYCYDLSRDDNGRLYCYYKDAQEQFHKVNVYKVVGKECVYKVTVDGVVYETFLDTQAMMATKPYPSSTPTLSNSSSQSLSDNQYKTHCNRYDCCPTFTIIKGVVKPAINDFLKNGITVTIYHWKTIDGVVYGCTKRKTSNGEYLYVKKSDLIK